MDSEAAAHLPHYDRLDALAAAVVALVCALRWGVGARAAVAALFVWLLWLAARSDIEQRKIADGLNAQIAALGAAVTAATIAGWSFPASGVSVLSHLVGAVFVALPLVGAVALGATFGGGDIKLLAAAGLMLGAEVGLCGLLCGFVLAAAEALVLLARGKARTSTFALAPALTAGLVVALFFAPEIMTFIG